MIPTKARSKGPTVEWTEEGEIFPPGSPGDPDSARASRPWVLEEGDGTLRMWYSGHDGTTSRIVEAVKPVGSQWQHVEVAIEPGLVGDTDEFGVESPCVVRVPGGYLMAYGGSDGEHTRVHMAISADGHRWKGHGTVMQRGEEDALAATHCRDGTVSGKSGGGLMNRLTIRATHNTRIAIPSGRWIETRRS